MSAESTTPAPSPEQKPKAEPKAVDPLAVIKKISDQLELLSDPEDLLYARSLVERRMTKLQKASTPAGE